MCIGGEIPFGAGKVVINPSQETTRRAREELVRSFEKDITLDCAMFEGEALVQSRFGSAQMSASSVIVPFTSQEVIRFSFGKHAFVFTLKLSSSSTQRR